jgi:hypothetical protein
VTVSHTGSASLIISSSTIGGANMQDFQESVGCGFNAALGQGVNCPITVTFTPIATGQRTASISIVDNASNSPQNVSLSGTGVAPPTPAGSYQVFVSATSGSDTHGQTITVNVQ